MFYNVRDWYWIVGGDTSRVWSSASVAYVPANDAGYAAWLEEGNVATRIASEEELAEVFANQYPAGWPPTPQERIGALIGAGVEVHSTGTPAINALYAIDESAQQNISGVAAGIASRNRLPGGGATFNYGDFNGVNHAFTSAQFLNFASAIEDYVYALLNGDTPTTPLVIP